MNKKIQDMKYKLMMKLTIGSEAIFFISLIVSYLYFWHSGHFGKMTMRFLNIRVTAIFTVLLLASSVTFWLAEKYFKEGQLKKVKGWLMATILLGLVFLIGQANEYHKLLTENITISASEFGSGFYALTGFHGLHVLVGLIILLSVFIVVSAGYLKNVKTTVFTTVGMYWHFVDAVWLIVFTVIYVLPYLM